MNHSVVGVSVIALLIFMPNGAASFCVHTLCLVLYLKFQKERALIISSICAGMLSLLVLVPYTLAMAYSDGSIATAPSTIIIGIVYYKLVDESITSLHKKKDEDNDVLNL